MIDGHTHILPGMDDGAPDVQTSLTLLQMQAAQGVDTVALTPHFYREQETPAAFLARRRAAMDALLAHLDTLPPQERAVLPRLVLGAEVYWVPGLAQWQELRELCYAGTDLLLIEPPFTPWNGRLFDELYNLMGRSGLTPVIAHLDRYLDQKTERLDRLLEMELPIQVSAETLCSPLRRGKALRLLEQAAEAMVISDCHGIRRRKPNLGDAAEALRRKWGAARAETLLQTAEELLLPERR